MNDATDTTTDQLPTQIAARQPAADRRRVPPARRRAARGRVVRQSQQPEHPPRLRKRGEGFHALRRHPPAGGISHRDARASSSPGATSCAQRGLGGSTIRHRLASLASLFEYLCDKNAVTHNPVKGVERPRTESGEGKTPALGDHQARKLLDAPQDDTIKSKRDRASGRSHFKTRTGAGRGRLRPNWLA